MGWWENWKRVARYTSHSVQVSQIVAKPWRESTPSGQSGKGLKVAELAAAWKARASSHGGNPCRVSQQDNTSPATRQGGKADYNLKSTPSDTARTVDKVIAGRELLFETLNS
jgi:hypothetical protein